MQTLTLKQYIQQKLNNSFGTKLDYKKGEVVVWGGRKPCIGKIERPCVSHGFFKYNYRLSSTHTGCDFTYLRPASHQEKKLLGKKKMLKIKPTLDSRHDPDNNPITRGLKAYRQSQPFY